MGIRRNFRPTNLVTNGNFAGGTTGWINNSYATFTVTNGIATLLANSQYDNIYQNIATNVGVGAKFYACAYLMAGAADALKIMINDSEVSSNTATHTGSGTFERVSVIHTSTAGTVIRVKVQDFRASNWDNVYAKEVFAIDLTALFGAGNEPTQAWCDLNIPNWFDGTLSGGKRIGGVR